MNENPGREREKSLPGEEILKKTNYGAFMMHHFRIIATISIVILAIFIPLGTVQAIPPLPSSIYGTIKVNNNNVPDGTVIEAFIKDQVVAKGFTETYAGESVFALDIPGSDSDTPDIIGGKSGDVINFKIGGVLVDQTSTWQSGTNVQLNLTVTSSTTLNAPQPTLTPIPTQTAIIVKKSTPTSVGSIPITGQAAPGQLNPYIVYGIIILMVILVIGSLSLYLIQNRKKS